MASHRSQYSSRGVRHAHQRAGQGVRGNVAYRRHAESIYTDIQYPHWLMIAVNSLLVLLALALLLCIILQFAFPALFTQKGEERQVSFVLEFYDVDGSLSSSPVVGTSLVDPATGHVLGEIIDRTSRPYAVSAVVWPEGSPLLPGLAEPTDVEMPGYTVTVTVRATALYREGEGYRIGELCLTKGEIYTVSLAGTVISGALVATNGEALE